MKKIGFLILMVTMLTSCLVPAGASSSKDDAQSTNIQVEVGKVTELVFPAKVAKVVKGGVPDSVLVEVLESSVYLLPKTEEISDIFVTTVSGMSYPLTLHLGKEHDIKVKIGFHQTAKSNSLGGYYLDEMDLMKDLLLHKEPTGATILPGKGQVWLANKQIELTVDTAYELSNWKAFVLNAKNLIKNEVIIPIEQVSLPNLLAISSDRDMLFPKGQEGDTTKIYMIVEQ